MRRAFNTTGPCVPGEHYMLPPEDRCPGLDDLIEGKHFFVLHAARQTGKTTLMQSVARRLNAAGRHHAIYCSIESAQGLDEPERGIPAIVAAVESALRAQARLEAAIPAQRTAFNVMLKTFLQDLCRAADRPVVVFFDEADCLAEGTLISFLRQLRDGYVSRADIPFVHALALVGMRNIRDYKARVRE
ncbi:MAG: ATP-binding protein, partial [Kiritimatiellae bacterium]|nr:ATP-binding protein [Kiritimatiellia bacterium]